MTPSRRRLLAPSLVLGVTLLAGCSTGFDSTPGGVARGTVPSYPSVPSASSPTGTTTTPAKDAIGPADFAAIRRVLARRAVAVMAGQERVFMATVDKGRPAFYQSQQVMYDNLEDLPVTSISYDVGESGLINASGIKGGPLLSPEIVEHVYFRGTDERPIGNEVYETFVRRDGHWLLAADATSTDQTNGDTARPWAGPRISVVSRGALVVIADASEPGSAEGLASTITADIAFDADILGVPVDDHVMVDATSGGSVSRFDNKEAAGAVTFAVNSVKNFRSDRLAGYRIKVNPDEIPYLSQIPELLRHELTHYLMYRFAGVNPKWLTEGLAEYVSHRPDGLASEYMTSEAYDRLLNRPHEVTISGLFGQDPATDYPLAMACVTYLVDHGGIARVLTLMRTFAAYPYQPFQDSHTRQALEQVYGFGPNEVAQGAFALLANLR